MRQAIHVWVTGRVQGVSYRYYTVQAAQQFGITGWVRNLPDGRVEAWCEGEADPLAAMVAWCWQGSPAAEVTGVQTQVETPQGYREFVIRR